jgi:uncharacterized membrane protein
MAMKRLDRLALVVAVLSFVVLVAGIALIYPPAALIVAGVGPLALCLDHLRGAA